MIVAKLYLILLLVSPEVLRCQLPTITDWRNALIYGDLIGYEDFTLDGVTIHTRWQTYRKRLIIFIYKQERGPEPNAWHGCGMYDLSEYFP